MLFISFCLINLWQPGLIFLIYKVSWFVVQVSLKCRLVFLIFWPVWNCWNTSPFKKSCNEHVGAWIILFYFISQFPSLSLKFCRREATRAKWRVKEETSKQLTSDVTLVLTVPSHISWTVGDDFFPHRFHQRNLQFIQLKLCTSTLSRTGLKSLYKP